MKFIIVIGRKYFSYYVAQSNYGIIQSKYWIIQTKLLTALFKNSIETKEYSKLVKKKDC